MSQPAPNPLPSANAPEPPEAPTPEEPSPMLDVHPPHHAANTWRDFLIHIATIVVGLLIAVGLEQTVEYIHHRREVAETRYALRKEHARNDLKSAYTLQEYRRISAAMQTNLAILTYLQQHPGAPPEQWPGKFNWSRWTLGPDQSAWETAQKSTVLSFMPALEVRDQSSYYQRMQDLHAAQADFAEAFIRVQSFRIRQSDPSRLTPAQINDVIALLADALLLHLKEGNVAANITQNYPSFLSPSRDEIFAIMHSSNPVDPAILEAADKLKTQVKDFDDDSDKH